MWFKSKTQPHCRWCGKPIRKHTVTVWLDTSKTWKGQDTEYSRHLVVENRPETKEECQKFTNKMIVSVRRYYDTKYIWRFNEWDGESYEDAFFCTTACSSEMGYAAAKHHNFVTPAWRKATGNIGEGNGNS